MIFTGTGSLDLAIYDASSLCLSKVLQLRLEALDNAIASNTIFKEIHDVWIRQPGYGFQILRSYGSTDIKNPLSGLAVMMINRGRIFDGCMLVQRGTESGVVVDWLFLESNFQSNYVLFESICENTMPQGNLSSTLDYDQNRMKCAASRMITILGDVLLLPFLYSNQVLASKLNIFDLFLEKVSYYIGDFRFVRLINLCKRFYDSTTVLQEHINEIKKLREIVGTKQFFSL